MKSRIVLHARRHNKRIVMFLHGFVWYIYK